MVEYLWRRVVREGLLDGYIWFSCNLNSDEKNDADVARLSCSRILSTMLSLLASRYSV